MESEFRVQNPTPAPGYPQAVISALRQTRKKHPLADAAAGLIPGVGAGQAAMDATDQDSSDFQRMLAVGSLLPGLRLARTIAKRLRKTPVKAVEHVVEEFKPEDIFQKPSGLGPTSPETVEAANKAYAEQLLKEESGNVVDFRKQKKTAEQLRKENNQRVQAEAKLDKMFSNLDNIDTDAPARKLPASVFFKNDRDEGDFLMGADKWERANLKWNDEKQLLHPSDGWIGPDHPDYLEPLDDYKKRVLDYFSTKKPK